MSHATEIGVTGTIQRYHHFDVAVYIEGHLQQLQTFFNFLGGCIRDGMFLNIERSPHETVLFRSRTDFSIVTDHSRTVEKGGKVEKGPHSDDDHEKNSVSSAGSGIFLGIQPYEVTS